MKKLTFLQSILAIFLLFSHQVKAVSDSVKEAVLVEIDKVEAEENAKKAEKVCSDEISRQEIIDLLNKNTSIIKAYKYKPIIHFFNGNKKDKAHADLNNMEIRCPVTAIFSDGSREVMTVVIALMNDPKNPYGAHYWAESDKISKSY